MPHIDVLNGLMDANHDFNSGNEDISRKQND